MGVSLEVKELVLQALEHERGGVLIYETALDCVQNEDLRAEWEDYLSQTENHVSVLTTVCVSLGLDPGELTPGCKIVQHNGKSLIVAMKMALAANNPDAAELVACECVVTAETKDHLNWHLLGKVADDLPEDQSATLRDAYDMIEDQEDEHLYHTKGWCRELWLKSLGLEAVLPPPEEEQDVKSAAEAAEAEDGR